MAVGHPVADSVRKRMIARDDKFPFGRPPFIAAEMPFNPFKNNSATILSVGEILRLFVMLPVFFLRVALLIFVGVMAIISLSILGIGLHQTAGRPLPAWRRTLSWPLRLCCRGVLFALGFQWITVKGKPAHRQLAPILVCNHVSFADPTFIFAAHLPMVVTAKENLKLPIVGTVLVALQAITVDRSSPSSRREAAAEIRRRAECNDWPHVALFPEATTTNGRALVSFKTGAFAPGLPVQPIVVRYPHVNCDPSWVAEGPHTLLLVFRCMTQLHNYMEVEYLDVMEPTKKEIRYPHLFADRCRIRMARALNVNVTEHTYGDVVLALEAAKMKPPPPPGLAVVEFGRLEQLFKLEVKEAKGYLRKFVQMDISRSGLVSMYEFLGALHLPDSPPYQRLFKSYDTSQRGYINFREYLAGEAFISKHPYNKESISAAFKFSHLDKNGGVSSEDTKASLRMLFPDCNDYEVDILLEKFDMDKDGSVSHSDFANFLQLNPEYLAAIAHTNPTLVTSRASPDAMTVNGKP